MSSGNEGFRITQNISTQPADLLSVHRDEKRTTLITLGAQLVGEWPHELIDIVPSYTISWGGSQGRGGASVDVDAMPGAVISLPCEAVTISAGFRGYAVPRTGAQLAIAFYGVLSYGAAGAWRCTHTRCIDVPAGMSTEFEPVPPFMTDWETFLTTIPVALGSNTYVRIQPDRDATISYIRRRMPVTGHAASVGSEPIGGTLGGAARFWMFDNSAGANNALCWMQFSTGVRGS